MKTTDFEGPLETLLSLIEKRRLFINDISLGQVTDDYIAHIRSISNYPMEDIANFIVVASTLVLIKSRSILPTIELSKEEEGDITLLKERLRLHEIFRRIGPILGDLYGKQRMYERSGTGPLSITFAPGSLLTQENLKEALLSLTKELPKSVSLPKVQVRKVISLEETMHHLKTRVTRVLKVSFSEFARFRKQPNTPFTPEERVSIVVSFLAVLELFKQGIVIAEQHTTYGDIEIETMRFDTPSYQ